MDSLILLSGDPSESSGVSFYLEDENGAFVDLERMDEKTVARLFGKNIVALKPGAGLEKNQNYFLKAMRQDDTAMQSDTLEKSIWWNGILFENKHGIRFATTNEEKSEKPDNTVLYIDYEEYMVDGSMEQHIFGIRAAVGNRPPLYRLRVRKLDSDDSEVFIVKPVENKGYGSDCLDHIAIGEFRCSSNYNLTLGDKYQIEIAPVNFAGIEGKYSTPQVVTAGDAGRIEFNGKDQTGENIRFDLNYFDSDGNLRDGNGSALSYMFCVPADKQKVEEVRSIDPDLELVTDVKPEIRCQCSENEYLFYGSTRQKDFKIKILKLAGLSYITKIEITAPRRIYKGCP